MTKKFLPGLSEQAPSPQSRPSWHAHDGGWSVLREYADALETASETAIPAEQIKSIPSPWARLGLFEHALRSRSHPARDAIVEEWRGILGCIALGRRLDLNVEVIPADLDQASGPAAFLRQMISEGSAGGRWSKLGIIRIDGEIVGGSSPLTLLFTGFRPVRLSVPFLRNGRLIDPGAYFADPAHQDPRMVAELRAWIQTVRSKLDQDRESLVDYLGSGERGANRADMVLRELDDWARDLELDAEEERPDGTAELDESPFSPIFPPTHPGRVLAALRPLSAEPGRISDLQLRNREETVDPGEVGILIQNGSPLNGTVDLPALAGVPVREGRLQEGVSTSQLGPDPIDFSQLFQPRLIRVLEVSSEARALSVGGTRYLFPFDQKILDHLSPTDLMDRVTAESSGDAVHVSLEVPVRRGLHVRYKKTYDSADQVRGYESPDLAQWPNFGGSSWRHYFFYSRTVEPERTLELSPTVEIEDQASSSDGLRRWGRTSGPILAWVGRAEDQEGLLLVPTDPPPEPHSQWEISIDFGSTHTRVFRKELGMAGAVQPVPVELSERARMLLGEAGTLPDNFFPSAENPMQSPEEPRSLVRIPPGSEKGREWLPSEGIIFFDSLRDSAVDGVKSNLKWHDPGSQDERAFQSYVRHLYLSIAAEAADVGARITRIRTAFPSVFPRHLRNNHEEQWRTLESLFDVEVAPPIRESTALAAYLESEQQVPVAANLLAVDVGGSTADFAIHYDEEYRGDSLRLAGQVIVAAAAGTEGGRTAIRRVLDATPFATEVPPEFKEIWGEGDDEQRALLFNALLRFTDRRYGGLDRLARVLYQGPESEGERLIAFAGYLYAALSFYIGLMVRRSGLERDAFNLYFAGRGAGFLPWLNQLDPGAEQAIPETFFRAGAEREGSRVLIRRSEEDAKTEVGMGLLMSPEGDQSAPARHSTMVGEDDYVADDRPLSWTDDLDQPQLEKIQRPDSPDHLPKPVLLGRFLATFQESTGGQVIARALDLPMNDISAEIRNHLYQDLFGEASPWSVAQQQDQAEALLVEPLLITEIKSLLRYSTGLDFPGV